MIPGLGLFSLVPAHARYRARCAFVDSEKQIALYCWLHSQSPTTLTKADSSLLNTFATAA